jgi:aromatic ring-opening dioxygenase catalytic subunit (LigB family)
MSALAGVLATVHAPFITGLPGLAPPDRRERVMGGFEDLRSWITKRDPDLIIAFSNEHITNFLPDNVPAFCVSVGDAHKALPEFNLPEATVPGDADTARSLVEYAYDTGFDLSYSSELVLDHGTGLPLHFLTPDYDVPVITILQNAIWSPMPTVERSFQLGQMIRRFVESETSGRHVVVLGTGGISHWVGSKRHGDVDQDFDEWFLKEIAGGTYDRIRALRQVDIDRSGDGANEIRNWIAAAGAAGESSPQVVLKETFIPGWNTSAYQVTWN